MPYPPPGTGHFVAHHVKRGVWGPPLHRPLPNTWLYTWGEIAIHAMVQGDPAYRLSAMYIEYENVVSEDDEVLTDTVAREDGRNYYDGLASSEVRDYLRVPLLVHPKLSVISGYEGLLPDGMNNQAVLFAQSTGLEGVHGKPFAAANNSKICGLAVVATPDFGDATRDVIYARAYYAAEDQFLKQEVGQVGVSYLLQFK